MRTSLIQNTISVKLGKFIYRTYTFVINYSLYSSYILVTAKV